MPTFASTFIEESIAVVSAIEQASIEACAHGLADVRSKGGRLFILGVGGSAGHASHAVNDFRKLCGFEAYAPTDNVSELTARANDEGWDTTFAEWLRGFAPSIGRRPARVLRRRRRLDEARLGQPRARARARPGAAGQHLRHRRARGRVHGSGRRRLRGDPDRCSRSHHPPHRGAVRGDLAPLGRPIPRWRSPTKWESIS